MRFTSVLNLKVVALMILALSVTACGTSVKRMDTDEVKDLSGAWNDTDSQMVSKEMIDDVLSRGWLSEFKAEKKTKPAVIVGEMRNLSHEHINTSTFVQEMQRNLINSGKVKFVASANERQEIRGERADMDIHASEATRKAAGKEKGADFMLKGTINTIIDAASGDQVRFYQVNLTLISLVDNEIVWNGEKKIKKFVERSSLRF
jgi:penicillin-binding protein activator